MGWSQASTPMMSLSFMIRRSSPSSLISVPDHLPNSTRSPTLRSIGISLPASSRPPGPTAVISPCEGFSLAVSGMMMPPLIFIFGFDSLDHDTVMQRTKFGFSHEGSFWRVGLSVGFDSGSEHKAYSTPQGAEQLAFFGNHTLGVLIVRPGIWLDADPVKQRGLSRW